ncbi:MAG: GNAT family N-acetyltransferase, partial [Candidatus Hodarchaeales archaeon]
SVKKEDLASLEELYSQSIKNYENTIKNVNLKAYILHNKDLVKVAIHERELIGFIITYVSTPQKTKIFSLFVTQTYRNQGIGKKLLTTLEKYISKRFSELKYLSVRIPEEFRYSSQFFQQMNFETVTKINNYQKEDLSFPFSVNKSVKVRKAQKKDLDGILDIEAECFSEFWQMNRNKFAGIMKNPQNALFVAFLGKKLVGYNYNTLSISGLDGNFVRIATALDYQKKGIATTLTSHAFEWYKEKHVNRVLLSTYADSFQHNEMYSNWGFKKIDQEEIMAKKYT